MDYGIANVQGQPSEELACEIIGKALEYGVNCFDTAWDYGNSENTLGETLNRRGVSLEAKIVSKLSPPLNPADEKCITQAIEDSIKNLRIDRLWCMKLHLGKWLDDWDKGLGRALLCAKEKGLIRYLGVSVYGIEEARRALQHPDIQVVQIPCNLWDQSMLEEGIFSLAEKMGKLCFVRSIYLQGLLLMSPSQVAEKLPRAADVSQRWFEMAETMDSTPKELAFRFALSLNCPLVVGAETVEQVEENIRLSQQKPLSEDQIEQIRGTIAPLVDAQITDPRSW
jgi:aryl-alcohol dehydrogenase-like predicted oxidoreductase